MYYFHRYGFAEMGTDDRLGAVRHSWKGSTEEMEQTLDQCVNTKSQECTDAMQVMVVYFCGVKDRVLNYLPQVVYCLLEIFSQN